MSNREQFVMDLARQYNLTRQMACALAHLVRVSNVTHEAFHILFGRTDDRVLMYRLRRRLGKRVIINTMFGIGYYIDEVTRARIKQTIGDLYVSAADTPPTVQCGVSRVAVHQVSERPRSRGAGSGGRGCEAA